MENYIGLGIGLLIVILNKPYYDVIIWWNREVFGMKNEIPEWLHRGFIIAIGILFMSIFFIKRFG